MSTLKIDAEVKSYAEEKFIGFGPDTGSVKPVHIANGLFRAVLGGATDTKLLNRFVFWQKSNGDVPKDHTLKVIHNRLRDEKRLEASDISEDDTAVLRRFLKNVVNADNGVFLGGMESYSAGSQGFVSRDRIAQDGGELVAEWLRLSGSSLFSRLEDALHSSDDVITSLCQPLLATTSEARPPALDLEKTRFLHTSLHPTPRKLWAGLVEASNTLAAHIETHPNKLFRLRLVVHFASFVLIRHLTSLESYYDQDAAAPMPFLLDFSESASEPVARASLMTYVLSTQSISRFYAWAFAEYLTKRYTVKELQQEVVPIYKRRTTDEMREVWRTARIESKGIDEQTAFTIFGQALYDMMALEAEGNPITYMRQLGHRSGLLWPPTNLHPAKRFSLQQDMLETLVRGAVGPAEAINLSQLQERFWERYRLVVGGRPEDEHRLIEVGIYQADTDALRQNRERFAARLSRLDFAQLLADGVLKVELESPFDN